jgi:hypothetical protein
MHALKSLAGVIDFILGACYVRSRRQASTSYLRQ